MREFRYDTSIFKKNLARSLIRDILIIVVSIFVAVMVNHIQWLSITVVLIAALNLLIDLVSLPKSKKLLNTNSLCINSGVLYFSAVKDTQLYVSSMKVIRVKKDSRGNVQSLTLKTEFNQKIKLSGFIDMNGIYECLVKGGIQI
ncbi:hypothetical protein [Gynuella sp.]|uniref:hypothetical protein n=1 Tax=Gynuella sp. TaxID=2969146 RepID=UPI003D0F8CFE